MKASQSGLKEWEPPFPIMDCLACVSALLCCPSARIPYQTLEHPDNQGARTSMPGNNKAYINIAAVKALLIAFISRCSRAIQRQRQALKCCSWNLDQCRTAFCTVVGLWTSILGSSEPKHCRNHASDVNATSSHAGTGNFQPSSTLSRCKLLAHVPTNPH